MPNRHQAITCTNDDSIHWSRYINIILSCNEFNLENPNLHTKWEHPMLVIYTIWALRTLTFLNVNLQVYTRSKNNMFCTNYSGIPYQSKCLCVLFLNKIYSKALITSVLSKCLHCNYVYEFRITIHLHSNYVYEFMIIMQWTGMFAEALVLLCHLEWSHSNMTDGMQPGAKNIQCLWTYSISKININICCIF